MSDDKRSIRNRELAAIHTARRNLGIEEGDYRDLLEVWTGKRSAAKLTSAERTAVIKHFRKIGFERQEERRKVSIRDDEAHTQVGKIKALWLDMYERRIVRDPGGQALRAYVKRQTTGPAHPQGISHWNYLTPALANEVIEGLKQWRHRVLRNRAIAEGRKRKRASK